MTKRTDAKRVARRSRRPRSSLGKDIIAGLREAIAFERGEATGARFHAAPISVRRVDASPAPEFSADEVTSIRQRLGVSQAVFARLLNVSVSTTRSWEQGINAPGGAASRLLQVTQGDPDALLRYVRPSNGEQAASR